LSIPQLITLRDANAMIDDDSIAFVREPCDAELEAMFNKAMEKLFGPASEEDEPSPVDVA
jgi:hypothetical protein